MWRHAYWQAEWVKNLRWKTIELPPPVFKRFAVRNLKTLKSPNIFFAVFFYRNHFKFQQRNINDLKSSCGSTEFGDMIDWRLPKTGARGEVATIRPDNYNFVLRVKHLMLSFHSWFLCIQTRVESREYFQVLLTSFLIFTKPLTSSLQTKFMPESDMVIELTKCRSHSCYMNMLKFGNF